MALIVLAIGIGSLVFLYEVFVGQKDRVNTEALKREIRVALPLGSPISAVEGFLQKRGIEFSFEASSKTGYAIVRNIKGSSIIVSKSLTLKFHFDDTLNLKSIDAEVLYTGP
ncbi:MAG: hypothetical protein ABSC08_01465 [Bryobacteraceae bacterium]|jgi:hypothetical protein